VSAFATEFGRRLRRIRRMSDLSQEAVAERAGIHRTNISLYENGERVPSVETFAKLAGALGIDATELLGPIRWTAAGHGGGRFKFGDESSTGCVRD
jgi:transcriptional regulator with XRE-family HTH domain